MPSETRFFSWSNLRTLAVTSSPTASTSDGCLTRRQARSVMCSRPSMPPRVDERAVIGDVLDDALDDRAFRQRRQQLFAHFALALLEHGAARHDDVVALAVELDDLEVERLVLERRRVLDRTDVDQRARQERADAVDHHREAALHLAGDEARRRSRPCSIAASRSCHALRRLALSRDRRVSP